MGFHDGAYCKLWKLDTSRKFPQGQISISRKDKQTGEYVDDFSGFVDFMGEAATAVQKLPAQGRFKIKSCDVSRVWSKEKQREFINFRIFDLEPAEQNAAAPAQRTAKGRDDDDMSVAELEARLAEAKMKAGKKAAEKFVPVDDADELPFD